MDPNTLDIVALEEHFLPDGYSPPPIADLDFLRLVDERMRDVDSVRLEQMDSSGIRMTVLSVSSPGVQGILDWQEAVDGATAINETLASIVRRHPDRYRAFAAIPMHDPEAAAHELERAVLSGEFVGALVNGCTNGPDPLSSIYYDDPRFDPLWATFERLEVPLYFHTRVPPTARITMGDNPQLYGPLWGFTMEAATHILRIIVSGTFDRFPRLKFILGHLGELLPFNSWRATRWSHHTYGRPLQRSIAECLRENFWYTTSSTFDTITFLSLIQHVGMERVMFAIDYPYVNMDEGSDWLRNLPLTSDEMARLAAGNACRLLRLPNP